VALDTATGDAHAMLAPQSPGAVDCEQSPSCPEPVVPQGALSGCIPAMGTSAA
jgi:hypothetical protein